MATFKLAKLPSKCYKSEEENSEESEDGGGGEDEGKDWNEDHANEGVGEDGEVEGEREEGETEGGNGVEDEDVGEGVPLHNAVIFPENIAGIAGN
ncbi:hypothetical protein H0H87_002206 [Tephrocybe sp. NHM501043]|nr:hypothetical protein H0H87_002206 [Tephrocybe sp. NHM501043]